MALIPTIANKKLTCPDTPATQNMPTFPPTNLGLVEPFPKRIHDVQQNFSVMIQSSIQKWAMTLNLSPYHRKYQVF